MKKLLIISLIIVITFVIVSCTTNINKSTIKVSLKGDIFNITSKGGDTFKPYDNLWKKIEIQVLTNGKIKKNFNIDKEYLNSNSFEFTEDNFSGTHEIIVSLIGDIPDTDTIIAKGTSGEIGFLDGFNEVSVNIEMEKGSINFAPRTYQDPGHEISYSYEIELKSAKNGGKIEEIEPYLDETGRIYGNIPAGTYELWVNAKIKDTDSVIWSNYGTGQTPGSPFIVQVLPAQEIIVIFDPLSTNKLSLSYPFGMPIIDFTATPVENSTSAKLRWKYGPFDKETLPPEVVFHIAKKVQTANSFRMIKKLEPINRNDLNYVDGYFEWTDTENMVPGNITYAINTLVGDKESGYQTANVYISSVHENDLYYNGHWYRLVKDSKNWTDAKSYCESINGHLVIINDSDENNFIVNNLLDGTNYWIGLNCEETPGIWKWADGTSLPYFNWNSLEPDNYFGNENYVFIDNAGTWCDVPNQWEDVHGFICEFDY